MKKMRAAIYTRKSSEEGLDQEFNSLDAQREACEAFIASQKSEGWSLVTSRYDDGGWSGGTIERPGLQKLLCDVEAGKIDTVVVYKVDRLSRSLSDFAQMVDLFDRHEVSFVSVTQAFNTTSSMGRLTLNVLLSFAQFEREVTGERIRDKIAASKAKGMWMGGRPPLGYNPRDRKLIVDEKEATTVRYIFERFLKLGSVYALHKDLKDRGILTKRHVFRNGTECGGIAFGRGNLAHLLANRIYIGEIVHKGISHPGLHEAIVDRKTFDAAQEALESNRRGRNDLKRKHSPVAGLLHDALGNRMTATHACGRSGQRYLYYVSPVSASDPDAARVLRRVPALNIEEVVIERLRCWSTRPQAGWSELLRFIRRIDLHPDSIVVDLVPPPHETWSCAISERMEAKGNGSLLVTSPVKVLTRGGRTTQVAGIAGIKHSNPDRALIAGLRRAHLELGKMGVDLSDPKASINNARGPGDPWIRKLVRLAFLAPDLQRTILEGRQPVGMKLADLMSQSIPLDWAKQRELFKSD